MRELAASISHELAQLITATTAHAKASLRWLQREPPNLTEVRKGTERIMEAGTLASESLIACDRCIKSLLLNES